jgi:hypothetical protein
VRRALLAVIPAIVALLAGAACSRPSSEAEPRAAAVGSAPAPSSSWSREALAPQGAGPAPLHPAVMGSIDPSALEDLIAAAPKPAPLAPIADGGPSIGAVTGVPEASESAIEPPPPAAKATPRVIMGAATVQVEMANPTIERAARAQLYWNLVQRCRDKEGKILPPDAISMRFLIDIDGYIAPSSIVARATSPAHADAAHCMRRELSTATFRAPAATWGHMGEVRATLPSVD